MDGHQLARRQSKIWPFSKQVLQYTKITTIQKSKFDKHAEKIKELLDYGLSVRKISSVLEYTNHIALNTYINKRNLKKKL